jgi:DNA repair protein RadC
MLAKIKDLPKETRPRERLLNFGVENLSLSELLEIIVVQGSNDLSVTEIARNLLAKYSSLENLFKASVIELCSTSGIGFAKAAQIKAALELGKRFYSENANIGKSVFNSSDAFELASTNLKGKTKEHLLLFCLNTRNALIGRAHIVSVGTLNGSLIHPREIFNIAISQSAAAILLAHNHPSGDASPSSQDLEATTQIHKAGMVMGIPLVDHLIVANKACLSMQEVYPNVFS